MHSFASRWFGLCGLFVFFAGLTSAQVRPHTFDVRDYGADGTDAVPDTFAVNKAIEAAHAVGGGIVYFPPGTYLCGSIHLQSNITLYLQQGAVIEATDDPSAYDKPEPNEWGDKYQYQDYGHSHWHDSLIWGENLENIFILGPGRIYGKGLSNGIAKGDFKATEMGNKAIALKNCRNVVFRDFTLQHGGWFGILATGVDNLTIDNLTIDTNRDGMDIDCCKNVHVSNCNVNSPHDDGICLKSTYALGYARPTEDVTITNCEVSGYDEGTFIDGTYQRTDKHIPTGRIKFGTESNGGFKNITISNCVFDYCRGLALETVDGALLEDVTITNITMRDIVNAPIFVRIGARMRGPADTPVGTIRRVIISNIVAHNVSAQSGILIAGLPGHPIEDLTLSHIFIDYKGGGAKEAAARAVDEEAKEYPEPDRFGTIPSYGLFARHVRNLSIDHVELRYAQEDLRPAIMLDDVAGADFDHLKAQHAEGASIFVLKNVGNFTVSHSPGVPDTQRDNVDSASL